MRPLFVNKSGKSFAVIELFGCEFLSTTHTSIEEISGKILQSMKLDNKLH